MMSGPSRSSIASKLSELGDDGASDQRRHRPQNADTGAFAEPTETKVGVETERLARVQGPRDNANAVWTQRRRALRRTEATYG
jgi:hypothetical protein